jgi:alpha-D-ribose 1-methylphosphonate 5-triphosphate synthase subunit PhnG
LTTSYWLEDHLERVGKKQKAEETAIADWLRQNPQATAVQYIEQVKKISEALRERETARSPL